MPINTQNGPNGIPSRGTGVYYTPDERLRAQRRRLFQRRNGAQGGTTTSSSQSNSSSGLDSRFLDKLYNFDPNVNIPDVSNDPLTLRRSLRARQDIAGAANTAGLEFQRRTGLGAGTAGGAGQAAYLKMMGTAQGARAADDIVQGEREFQTAVGQANRSRALDALLGGAGQETSRRGQDMSNDSDEKRLALERYMYDRDKETDDFGQDLPGGRDEYGDYYSPGGPRMGTPSGGATTMSSMASRYRARRQF